MKIERYANEEKAKEIRAAIQKAGGHCPCSIPAFRNNDTLCMCKDFRNSPAGTICHCGLYKKVE